jgi:hypothetical protein
VTDSAVVERPAPLDLALLKAVGLDRAAPEQRQLAIAIAERYGLDLMLKHLVLIEGRPYVTRDALLHIAHRSGQFDGIETTTPEIVGDEWRATATVWRKDMTHPFVYGGRYPTKGGNQRFAPEMCLKVAESMALRRAFDVSAPVMEERWDVEPVEPPAPRPTLAEVAAAKAANVAAVERAVVIDIPEPEPITGHPAGIVNPEEVAEGAPVVAVGLSVDRFRELCMRAGKSTVAIGKVIETTADKVGARVKAMTDVERGVLADELGIEWRQ